MSGTYEGMGELHDLFMHHVWDELRDDLSDAFGVLHGDQVLRRASFRSDWNPPTIHGLRGELARNGLALSNASDRLATIRAEAASS